MISRAASSTDGRRGQALVEFVAVAMFFSVIFTGVLFFGRIGVQSLLTDVEARNNVFRERGMRDNREFRAYLLETPEMTRFVRNYEMKLNPAGLNFARISSVAACSLDRGAFPALARGYKYRSTFAMDYPAPALPAELKDETMRLLSQDLFGIVDKEGGR